VGAEPLGLTNCLNFANPERPEIAWQLERSVAGMAAALTELGVPVVGGNVSLYNQSGEGPIYPTPVVGMVGAVPDLERVAATGFYVEGHVVALVAPAEATVSLSGSELAKLHGLELPDGLPAIDAAAVKRAIELVRDAVRGGGLASAHDVAEGGLAVALAECCLAGGLGATVELEASSAESLFGEGVGRFVVSGPADAVEALGPRARPIGTVGGDRLAIGSLSWPLGDLREASAALALAFP